MHEKITLYQGHCLISMYQITNLCDNYERNDWIFQSLGTGAIFES